MKLLSLIGFMGCGKSSVGRRLSQLLSCPFIDLDEVIVERAGKSIPEIFADDGEKAFRQMELEALQYVIENSLPENSRGPLPHSGPLPLRGGAEMPLPFNRQTVSVQDQNGIPQTPAERGTLVLALGGGTVMTPECAEIVRSETRCIYLRSSVETLIGNLEGQTANRPLLNLQNCHSDQNSNCHFERAKRVEKSIALKSHIESLMVKRSTTYEKTAHIIIDTDGKSIEAIASEIISTL